MTVCGAVVVGEGVVAAGGTAGCAGGMKAARVELAAALTVFAVA